MGASHRFLRSLPADNCTYLTFTQQGLVDKDSYQNLAGWLTFMHKKFKDKPRKA
jgi:hypothetical protein